MASSSSSVPDWKYDVFLNFRGEDTRRTFISHLHKALARNSINTFIDAEELRKGEGLSQLLTAISDSRLSIVVFSQNYASSTWCLKELVQILQCMDQKTQIVIPIFYEVDPSHVRKIKRSFEEAFSKHEHDPNADMEEVQRWRSALQRAPDLCGWDSQNYQDDAKLIELIVDDIFKKLFDILPSEKNGLVGMDSRLQKMDSLLCPEVADVRCVGIWGMGGIGKTTIARAMYHEINHHFEGRCFVENVKGRFPSTDAGEAPLDMQAEILSSVTNMKVGRSEILRNGFQKMMERVGKKKVLLVLDNVESSSQIEALIGEQPSFGGGSRIIITTRDKQSLSRHGGQIYKPELLNDNDALKLFMQYAFSTKQPTKEYINLSRHFIKNAQGLPLALKVLGAFLDNKSESVWKYELKKIASNPHLEIHQEIQTILRTSFDGLDRLQKDIFLHIACFFKQMKKDFATRIMEGWGFHPHTGLDVLVGRALVTISSDGVLEMHDLLEEMGREIVLEKSIEEPGRCSRLWSYEDVCDVLTEKTAESKILRGPREDLESYLEAIDQLRRNTLFFSSTKGFRSSDEVLSDANGLLAKAISKREEEFKQLLLSYSKPVEPERLFDCLPTSLRPSSESPGNQGDYGGKNPSSNNHPEHHNGNLENAVYTTPALIPLRVLPLLHDLAQQMFQAGHHQQLLIIYRDTRSSVLEQSLLKLGVEKLSKDDVQNMQWEILEAKIGNWIHYMRIAVKLLFAGERKVCDQMFETFDSLGDQCFAEVTRSSVSVLISFGEAIANSKRSPEKLFVLLDMYEIMRELHSEIETIFIGNACAEIRESASSLTKRLAQTAKSTFGDFEEAVERDATKTAVTDGTVHPLTIYVINFVKFLFDYQSTLKQLFKEFENGDEGGSQLAAVTMQIMQALQTNLDGKSKQYRDPALTHLFLMNNIHYMVRSVWRSEAKDLLGDDWVQRHLRIVQQHANQYKRNVWGKILQCLSIQGLTSSGGGSSVAVYGGSSGVSRAVVKDRFKTFNTQFEECHKKQSQWTVPDTELRESLRLAVAVVLLPGYRSFIKRYGPLVESGKNLQKYIRYTVEDLDRMLGEFFEGKNVNEPRR